MKKLMLAAIWLISLNGMAQFDEKRMERDLEVAKNILGTLLSENNEMFLVSRNIEASWLPEYGVIFTLPEDPMMWSLVAPRIVMERGNRSFSFHVSPDEENKEVMIEEGEEEADMKKEQEDYQEHVKVAIVNFLADYADLIGQLKPEHRIMVNQKPGPEFTGMIWVNMDEVKQETGPGGLSAEISKKDITDYKNNKISRETFTGKIRFSESNRSAKSADLDLFSKIMRSYFSPDMSETYFMEGNPTYEKLENVGVIYNIKTFSSYQDGDMFRMPTLDKTYNQEERNRKAEELYPEFETDIKNFVLDYGRTIRSLGENELLILKIKLTRCDHCSMPKAIDVTLRASTLRQYDQQQITKDKALSLIEIKKY